MKFIAGILVGLVLAVTVPALAGDDYATASDFRIAVVRAIQSMERSTASAERAQWKQVYWMEQAARAQKRCR